MPISLHFPWVIRIVHSRESRNSITRTIFGSVTHDLPIAFIGTNSRSRVLKSGTYHSNQNHCCKQQNRYYYYPIGYLLTHKDRRYVTTPLNGLVTSVLTTIVAMANASTPAVTFSAGGLIGSGVDLFVLDEFKGSRLRRDT